MSKLYPLYGRGAGEFLVLPPPIPFENAPTSNQTNFAIGQVVYTPPTSPTSFYIYGGAGNWILFSSSSGDIISIVGTTNEITAVTALGVATLSIPSAFIAPGSIASTTTLTGGTGITATTGNIVATAGNITTTAGSITSATTLIATLGNITATAGNFVSATAGDGIVLNSGTASGTTSATLNGRSGQITITTPSIGAGATFVFTIANTSVLTSATQVLYGLTGGTTGAAITIQSVANTSHQSVVTLMNGSGDTASTGSLVLTFLVLN